MAGTKRAWSERYQIAKRVVGTAGRGLYRRYKVPADAAMIYGGNKLAKAINPSKYRPKGGEPTESRTHRLATPDGAGGSISSFSASRSNRLPKAMKQSAKVYTYTNGAGQILGSNIGKQTVTSVYKLFDSADSTSVLGTSGVTAGSAGLLTGRGSILLTNAANTTAKLTIYDIIARKDNSTSITANPGVGTPLLAWSQGTITDEAGTANTNLFFGSTPYTSKVFTELYKVVKTTDVMLDVGRTHQHQVTWSPLTKVDDGYLKYQTVLKNISYYCMVVAHGQADDAVTGGAGPSLGQHKINYIWNKELVTTYVQNTQTVVASTDVLPTSFTGGEDLMGEATGVAAAYATA